MKTLKAICTAAVLVLTLSVTAHAVDIQTPGLTAGTSTPGVTQAVPNPEDTGSSALASPAPAGICKSELTAILLTLAALF